MRNMLLTSALSGSLALTPQALMAQDYDSWTLGREVLNAAANYTGVLTTAHAQVRKYITWQWGTTLPEADQRKRTADLLAEITTRQQVTAALVPSLDSTVIDGFGIRFRYCDGMLLSYFTSTGFKHGLSAQQIVDAPELRARRADTAFTGEPLGIVKTAGDPAADDPAVDDPAVDDPTVGGNLILQTGDRSQIIPACMGTKFGGALDVDTVAYMTSAAQKFGVARVRKRRETRKRRCVEPQVGPGIKEERFKSTDYNARGDKLYNTQSTHPYDPEDKDFGYSYYDTATPEADGHWKTKYTHCRNPGTIPVRRVEDCSPGSDRIATYEYFLTEAYAAFPETVWLPSDAQGKFVDEAVGVLVPHLSFCEGAPDRQPLAPVITTRTDDRPAVCPATHPLGTVTEARTVTIRTWSFADSPDVADFPALSDIVIARNGPWAVSDDRCYRNANDRTSETRVSSCPSGQIGSVTYQRQKTVTGVDWYSDGWQDALSTTHTQWAATANTCRYRPPPPPPKTGYESCSRGDCIWVYTSGGGEGGGGRDEGSSDVDGDGFGDYNDFDSRGFGGTSVSTGCGGCNGPSSGPTGGGNSGGGNGGGCFLTTAIVAQRGEADDGPTLTTLRAFRDGYMARRPNGAALVAEYYDVAPRIVTAIPTDDPAWHWIGTQVDLAVTRIEADDLAGAFAVYTAMVQRLKADWLTPITAPAPHSDINQDNKNKETVQ